MKDGGILPEGIDDVERPAPKLRGTCIGIQTTETTDYGAEYDYPHTFNVQAADDRFGLRVSHGNLHGEDTAADSVSGQDESVSELAVVPTDSGEGTGDFSEAARAVAHRRGSSGGQNCETAAQVAFALNRGVGEVFTVAKGAMLFTDGDAAITDVAPELDEMKGIRIPPSACGTLHFNLVNPAQILVGFEKNAS